MLHRQPALSPAIVLVLAGVVFALLNSRFYQLQNLSLVAQQVAVVGSLAVGQTLIILTAGIDLSIGAVMVLASLVMSKLVVDQQRARRAGAADRRGRRGRGAVAQRCLVTRIKLPPFIVTLGTLSIFTAVTLIYARARRSRCSPANSCFGAGRPSRSGRYT